MTHSSMVDIRQYCRMKFTIMEWSQWQGTWGLVLDTEFESNSQMVMYRMKLRDSWHTLKWKYHHQGCDDIAYQSRWDGLCSSQVMVHKAAGYSMANSFKRLDLDIDWTFLVDYSWKQDVLPSMAEYWQQSCMLVVLTAVYLWWHMGSVKWGTGLVGHMTHS